MAKKFNEWIQLKERLHSKNNHHPLFNENEIWWCSIGENVGVEVNGKSEFFTRPIFIYRKLSRGGFLGIPMTTQEKNGSWYVEIDFRRKRQWANLAQCRVLGTERLFSRMGVLDDQDSERIRAGFVNLYR